MLRLTGLCVALVLSVNSGCLAFSPSIPAVTLRARSTVGQTISKVQPGSWRRRGAIGLNAVIDQSHAPVAMKWDELGSKPWGSVETDFMYVSECSATGEWTYGEVKPYGNIEISPRAGVLNYGQGIFEGMKAQRSADGRIVLFRPDRNARRVRYGCERVCMPPVPEEIFIRAIKDTVLANAKWVPPCGKGSLYIRPLVVGTGPILGLAPAPSYTFMVYVSPVGSYFKGSQMTPIKLKVEDQFSRAAPGGTGGTKSIGNYGGSLLPQVNAKKAGFDNVLYIDANEKKYLEEVGTSNVFLVKGKKIYTPPLVGGGEPSDTILEGVTRESVIQVAKDAGFEVLEQKIPIDQLRDADEAFTVGTAVVVSPIGSVTFKGEVKKWSFAEGAGPVTTKIYDTLTGIQSGRLPDPYGWTVWLD